MLKLRRRVLPWLSAVSIALGFLVVLPQVATASVVNEFTTQSCSETSLGHFRDRGGYGGAGNDPRRAALGSRLLPSGCGAAGSQAGARTGKVVGTVQLRACGGAPPLGIPKPCLFRPLAGAQVELSVAGQTVKRAMTNSKGRYSVRVAAGTYAVRVVWLESSAFLSGSSRTVTVNSGQRVAADFQLMFQAA